jgi:hypothetical protein
MTTLANLRKMGFEDAPTESYKRLILSLEGEDKTGKTHMALTAPEPIIFFSLDIGTEGVVEKFRRGFKDLNGIQIPPKEILVYEFRVPKAFRLDEETTKKCLEFHNDFRTKFEAACGIESGTIVVDTSSERYEMARLAKFGKLSQVLGHHYTEINQEYREEIGWAFSNPKLNVVLIHKMKDKWSNNVNTGQLELAGFKDTHYLAQAAVRLYRTTTTQPNGSTSVGIQAVIKDSRHNLNVAGSTVAAPITNFNGILGMVHGG